MAQAVRSGQVTPADELRELLTESEKLVVNVRGRGAGVLELLRNLDRIAQLWPELEAAGVDLRPEAGRWETLRKLTHKQAAAIVSELGGSAGMAAARVRQHGSAKLSTSKGAGGNGLDPSLPRSPAPLSNWWWYLDREVRDRRRTQAIRLGSILAIAVIAIAGGLLLFQKLFPVDPKVSAASSRIAAGQQKVDNGQDFAAALPEFRAATELTPNDPMPWLYAGATEEKLGHAEAAQQAYDRARALFPSDLDFRLARAPVYTEFAMVDPARADLAAALKEDPDNPQAYYFLATIEEGVGNTDAALDYLRRASDAGEKRGQLELTAMSRVRMGLLLQQIQAQVGAPGATRTP